MVHMLIGTRYGLLGNAVVMMTFGMWLILIMYKHMYELYTGIMFHK